MMGFFDNPAFWKVASSVVTLLVGAFYTHGKLKESGADRYEDALQLARTCYLMVEMLAARGKLKAIPAINSSLSEVKESRGISEFVEAWKRMGYKVKESDLDVARMVFRQWATLNFDPHGVIRSLADNESDGE